MDVIVGNREKEKEKSKNFSESNIYKAEIFHVLDDKVALLTIRRSEWGTRNCH